MPLSRYSFSGGVKSRARKVLPSVPAQSASYQESLGECQVRRDGFPEGVEPPSRVVYEDPPPVVDGQG